MPGCEEEKGVSTMAGRSRIIALALAGVTFLLASVSVALGATAGGPAAPAKISPMVLRDTGSDRATRFLVIMRSQANVDAAAHVNGQQAKGRFVYRTLKAFADRSQAPVRAFLER